MLEPTPPTPAAPRRSAAPGLEQWLWRRLPHALVAGLALPWAAVLLRRWAASAGFAPAPEAVLLRWDYFAYGWTFLHLSLWVAVATGCVVVRVMKGPQYSADSYPPQGRSSPLKAGVDSPAGDV